MDQGKTLLRMFEAAGFTLVRCKNHQIWNCPCGHAQVVTASTPSESRGVKNARALMNRTLRACTK